VTATKYERLVCLRCKCPTLHERIDKLVGRCVECKEKVKRIERERVL